MRLQKGLDITRESWQVLKRDRQLLVFPILSTSAAILIVCTVVSAFLFSAELDRWAVEFVARFDGDASDSIGAQALVFAGLLVAYFVQWSIVIYCNTALVGCALIRFSGGEPTIKDGLRLATKRLPQILAWALLTSVVGAILSSIEQRLSLLGKIIITIIGLQWSVACYFVVPVLAEEGTGPITAIKRSVGLLRKIWGEGLTGNIVIGIGSLVVKTLLIGLGVAGVLLAHRLDSSVMTIVTVAMVALALISLGIFTSALRQIFLAGLYEYAKTGRVPDGFSENSMRRALATSVNQGRTSPWT